MKAKAILLDRNDPKALSPRAILHLKKPSLWRRIGYWRYKIIMWIDRRAK